MPQPALRELGPINPTQEPPNLSLRWRDLTRHHLNSPETLQTLSRFQFAVKGTGVQRVLHRSGRRYDASPQCRE